MGPNLMLVGLLTICSLSFGEECNSAFEKNVDFPGSDITFLYSPDVEHCQQLCTQHSDCQFFTFIRADWTRDDRHFYCYIKKTPDGQPRTRTALLGVTSGFSLKPCSPDIKPCLSQVYQNVDFLGADFRALFTASYEECQRACTQDPACQFFTYVNEVFTPEKIRYKCHLKFSWVVPRPPLIMTSANVVSGFSHKVQISQNFTTACQPKLFQHTDIPGSDIETLVAASPEHCHMLCSAHPRCTYFSYVSADFNCHLKDNPNEMVTKAKNGVTSGLPARSCQLDNNWLKVAYEGVDFRGSDMFYVTVDNADACAQNCTEDPLCQFYTYATEKYHDRNYWHRCFHKRVITMPAPPKVTKLANVVSGFSLKNCDKHRVPDTPDTDFDII